MAKPKNDPRLVNKLPTVNEDILNRSIRHSVYLEHFKNNEVDDIIKLLNQKVLPDLLRQISNKLEWAIAHGRTTSTRLMQLRDLFQANQGLVKGGLRSASLALQKKLEDFALTEARWLTGVMSESAPVALDFLTPAANVLKALVSGEPMHGKLLSQWFDDLSASTANRVNQAINLGVVAGEGVAEIVRRLQGTRDAGYADGVLNTTRRETEAIVRTSVNAVSSSARSATYEENSDLLNGIQIVATLDSRTSDICRGRDGEILAIDSKDLPPYHFNCRTTTVPVIKSWKQLGINLKEAPEGTRASMDGQVPASLTYNEWLKDQPASVQDEVLGPTRAELFRSGEVPIDKFTDTSGRRLTLTELQKKYDIPTG